MKILLVNKFHYPHGGADLYYLELGQRLEQLGHEVAYFAMKHPKNLPSPWSKYFIPYLDFSEVKNDPILAVRLVMRMVWSFEAKRQLKRLLREFKPDIAHVHNIYHHISPSILPVFRKQRIRTVMTAHDFKLIGPHYKLPPEKHLADRFFYTISKRTMKNSLFASIAIVLETAIHRVCRVYRKNVDTVFASSEFVVNMLKEYAGFRRSQVVKLPLGVAQADFVEFPDRRGMIYAGRLSEGKGLDWLVQTWRERNIAEPLTLVGSGPLEPKLKKMAKGLPIFFTGALSHKEALDRIARSRCLIAPSTYPETFGLSVVEALSLGTPVISSNTGALPERVRHGYNGYLVDVKYPNELGKKIQAFLSDPLKEVLMRENAIASVKDYTWSNHVDQLVDHYKTLR